jgi:hypothetical protein
MLLEHARAWRSMAAPPKRPDAAPPLTGDDAFALERPVTIALARSAIQPMSITGYAVAAAVAYSFGATFASLALRVLAIPALTWLIPSAAIVLELALVSPWSRARIWLLLQRRHIVHHLRFSSGGASWASALGSETRPWKSVQTKRRTRSFVLFGVTLRDDELEPGQRAAISGWSGVVQPVQKKVASSRRALVLWVLLIVGFIAVYQLVTDRDMPRARRIPIVQEQPLLKPPSRR